jgi:hypothetical protein
MSLTRITTDPKIRKFVVYDLEWIPHTLELRLVGVFDGIFYRSYPSIDAFLNGELTDKNRGKWFYAHAGGLADAQFLLEKFIDRPEFQVQGFFSGSSAVIIPVRKGKLTWTFVDSYWLLRDKLAHLARTVGLEKGGDDYRCQDFPACGHPIKAICSSAPKCGCHLHGDPTCIFYAPYSVLADYNRLDCVILWRAIDEFQKRLLALGGELRMTLASCAMRLFRRKFLEHDIFTHRAINQRAQLSYVASRVEVFDQFMLPHHEGKSYDVNSSFPFAMAKPVPGVYLGADERLPDGDGSTYLTDVTIRVRERYLPGLPFKHKSRVFFPVGEWRAWLTKPDVELLLRTGGFIQKVHEVLHFEPFSDLAQYVAKLYEMRRIATDDFDKLLLKLLLNSLYGKFAEGEEKTALLLNPPSTECTHERDTCSGDCMEMLFPGAWLQRTVETPEHSHVVMSSHITATARTTLFDFMDVCEKLFYVDTDCVKTTTTLPTAHDAQCRNPECAGCKLGGLKFEGNIGEAFFAAPKLYVQDGKVKAKGFSGMTDEKFRALLSGHEVDFLRMARIRENFRAGRSAPIEQIYKKRLRLKSIPKRCYMKNGGSRPWKLKEIL